MHLYCLLKNPPVAADTLRPRLSASCQLAAVNWRVFNDDRDAPSLSWWQIVTVIKLADDFVDIFVFIAYFITTSGHKQRLHNWFFLHWTRWPRVLLSEGWELAHNWLETRVLFEPADPKHLPSDCDRCFRNSWKVKTVRHATMRSTGLNKQKQTNHSAGLLYRRTSRSTDMNILLTHLRKRTPSETSRFNCLHNE